MLVFVSLTTTPNYKVFEIEYANRVKKLAWRSGLGNFCVKRQALFGMSDNGF
jgi:hypothetical protein